MSPANSLFPGPPPSFSADFVRNLREQVGERPFKPIEDLSGRDMTRGNIRRWARQTMDSGWVLGRYPSVDLAGEIPWDEAARTSRSWSYHLHCWDLLEPLLMAYGTRGRRNLLDMSLRVAGDWIARFSRDNATSPFAWYDMAVGLRAARLAFLIDAAFRKPEVPDEAILPLIESAEQHRAYLSDDRNIVYHNNHGFFQAAGQAALARRLWFMPDMAEGLQQARERLLRMLEQQFTSEHVHKEHSPDYFRMVLRTLHTLLGTGLLDDAEIAERYLACERAFAWFVFPHGPLVNFGDSEFFDVRVPVLQAEKTWRTAEMQFQATAGATGKALHDPSRSFPQSGYFVVRQEHEGASPAGASYLAVAAAYHSRTHKHADDLTLVWAEHGCPILVDSGRFGYLGQTEANSALREEGFWYSHPNRVYCESTHAHNTVEIDERSYSRRAEKPYGSAIERTGQSGALFYCECHVRHSKTVRHARTAILHPRHWLLVFDWLWDTAREEHGFAQWWHFPEKTAAAKAGEASWRLDVPGLGRSLFASALLPETTPSRLREGQREPRLEGWLSPAEGVLVPAPALCFAPKASSAQANFVTLFSLDGQPADAAATVPASGRRLSARWRDEGGEHALRLARPASDTAPVTVEYDIRRPPRGNDEAG